MKKMISVNILKVVAAILITNSHLKSIYPQSISFLAFGGAIGNGFFFVTSGFLIGYRKTVSMDIKWIKKKIIRLYPSVWLATPLYIIFNKELKDWSILSKIVCFVYPTIFWFVNAILVMYIITWLIEKNESNSEKMLKASMIISIVAYILSSIFLVDYRTYNLESSYIKCFYYYNIFALGSLIGKRYRKGEIMHGGSRKTLFVAFISFILHGITSVLTQRTGMWGFQFITHLSIIICSVETLLWLSCHENEINNRMGRTVTMGINNIALLTLEIYLLNDLAVELSKRIVFPISLFVLIIAISIGAYILHYLSSKFIDILRKKNELCV